MNTHFHGLSGSIALVIASAAGAQAGVPAQPTTSTSTQQGPAATQITTHSTTNTVPGSAGSPAQSATTSTSSTTAAPTDTSGAPVGPAQSSPAQSSATTSTTTSSAGAVTAATAADVKPGLTVYDQNGGVVGKVESVTAGNAVVNAGGIRAAIPAASFAKNNRGLVISMTRAELEASAKSAAKTTPKAKGTKKTK